MVLTRDITERVGRASVVAKILEGLSRDNDVTPLRLRSLLETRSVTDLAVALAVWLWSLIRLRPMPLQCLLYSSHGECAGLVRRIRDGAFSTVYLDTVRCQMLLRMLRRALPDIFIVTDFDDLMSRRMRYLAEHRLPLLVGHTGAVFPNWLRKLAEGPLARLVTHYEAASLRHAEQEAAHASNIVVLLSDKERALLRETWRRNRGRSCMPFRRQWRCDRRPGRRRKPSASFSWAATANCRTAPRSIICWSAGGC